MATFPIEADNPAINKFGYTNYKVDKSSQTSSANCKKCKALIREKIGTISAFVRPSSIRFCTRTSKSWVSWAYNSAAEVSLESSQQTMSFCRPPSGTLPILGSPGVPSKKLKLFDIMSKQTTPETKQLRNDPPNVARDFQRFLDNTSAGLNIFNDLKFASSLRPIALQLFSAPCSSTASERVFSQSGLIMRPTRSRLSPGMLAKLVFLKCNKHLR